MLANGKKKVSCSPLPSPAADSSPGLRTFILREVLTPLIPQSPWQWTDYHPPITETSSRTEQSSKGRRKKQHRKSRQHLLENSWWIYKELVYLVSYQMPHCSIFRNLEMREDSRHVSIPALQGWLYKYLPGRPWQPCPLIQKQPLAAALEVQQRWTLSRATSSPPPAASPRATPHLTSLFWSPGAGGEGRAGSREEEGKDRK